MCNILHLIGLVDLRNVTKLFFALSNYLIIKLLRKNLKFSLKNY